MTALKAFGVAGLFFAGGLVLVFIVGVVGGINGASDAEFVRFVNDTIPWLLGGSGLAALGYYITRKEVAK